MKHNFLGLMVIALGLAACSSTPKPTDPVALQKIDASHSVQLKWSNSIGDTNSMSFFPMYVAGSIYAANEKGQVYEIDFSSGKVLHSFDTKKKLIAGVAAEDNLVFVGDRQGYLLGFDKQTKQEVWQLRMTSMLGEAPMMVGNVLVVRTKDSRLSGIEPKTGKLLWSVAGAPAALGVQGTGSLIPAGAQVFLAAQSGGGLMAVNAQTGVTLWNVVVASPKGVSELERVTEVLSRPVIDGGQICSVAFQGRVACFDGSSGRLMWAQPASSSKGLDVIGNRLVLTEDDGVVKAFDRTTGTPLWTNNFLKNRKVSAPVALDAGILVVDFEGYAHLLHPEDGRILGRMKVDTKELTAQPYRLDSYAVLQGSSGKLALVGAGSN